MEGLAICVAVPVFYSSGDTPISSRNGGITGSEDSEDQLKI
jgi:hypothetical protein